MNAPMHVELVIGLQWVVFGTQAEEDTFEEAAEEPVPQEAEAPIVIHDVSAAETLETDMHPIAEHPAAEDEAATETATEVLSQHHCLPKQRLHQVLFLLESSSLMNGSKGCHECWVACHKTSRGTKLSMLR